MTKKVNVETEKDDNEIGKVDAESVEKVDEESVEKVDAELVEKVDEELVEKACNEITKIFSFHIEVAVIKVGEYLIKEFFDNNFEKAGKKDKIENSSKGASLNQVFKKFRRNISNSDSNGPSKTWLYDAINYVVQKHIIKKELSEKTFQTFGKLSFSHKIVLTTVANNRDKEDLIDKIAKKELSVRALKQEVAKLSQKPTENGILKIIRTPELLLEKNEQQKLTLKYLEEKSKKKLEEIQSKIDQRQKAYEEKKKVFELKAENYNTCIEKLYSLKINVDKALKTKESESKK